MKLDLILPHQFAMQRKNLSLLKNFSTRFRSRQSLGEKQSSHFLFALAGILDVAPRPSICCLIKSASQALSADPLPLCQPRRSSRAGSCVFPSVITSRIKRPFASVAVDLCRQSASASPHKSIRLTFLWRQSDEREPRCRRSSGCRLHVRHPETPFSIRCHRPEEHPGTSGAEPVRSQTTRNRSDRNVQSKSLFREFESRQL